MKPWIAFAVLAFAAPAFGADSFSVDSVTGVYKSRFADSTVDGHKYQAEDVLELVKVAPGQVYLRTHLDFYNGHICGLYGIANVEGDALVYRGKGNSKGCVLSLKPEGGKLVFHDKDGVCREQSCGMRGSYEGQSFDLSARRTIRYMKRLLASSEYASALAERDAKP